MVEDKEQAKLQTLISENRKQSTETIEMLIMNDDTSSEEEECSLINLLCYMEINAFDIPVVLVDQCLFYCFCRSLNNERNLNFSTVSPKSQVQMMNEIMAKDLS